MIVVVSSLYKLHNMSLIESLVVLFRRNQ